MRDRIVIEALGVRVAIDASALTDADARTVASAWRDAGASFPAVERAQPDDMPVVTAHAGIPLATLLSTLSQRVTLAAIEAQRGRMWMLHAAGIAMPDGRVVALVGPSGRGKTTASRVLGARYGYVSDETVAIDDAGGVHPYRKPLSIVEADAEAKAQRAPADLGLLPLPDAPLRLAGIVLLDRRDDAGDEPTLEHVDLGDALEELVAQSSYLADMPAPLHTVAALVASVGGVQRVTYREAASLLPVVPAMVEHPRRDQAPRPPVVERAQRDETQHPAYHRTPVLDALTLDDPDRLAVLQVDDAGQGTLRVLAGIAPAVWRAADGAALDELAAAAVAAYGAPESTDAAAAVSGVVDELAAVGLLEFRAPRWGIARDVAWTDSDRVVALDLAVPDAQPLALEGSAAVIWRALAEGAADADTIVARAAATAGVEPAAVADDVRAFLAQLAAQRLALPG